jgi:transposase-like protein
MDCIGCGSAAVSERSERTAQGYRRFRCRACGKQFNERSAGSLNRTQYPSDVIALRNVSTTMRQPVFEIRLRPVASGLVD